MFESARNDLLLKGYCIIDDVIPNKLIHDLRKKYLKYFTNDATLTCEEFLSDSELSGIIFSDRLVTAMSEIIGKNFCLYPDFTLRKNLYIPWYNDTPYLMEKERVESITANMVQASVYLQDNTLDNGGGLDVIEGSHHNKSKDEINFLSSQMMASKAGSLVLWDSRVWHKSREQTHAALQIPKLAIQWTVSRNARFSNHFLNYLKDRIMSRRQHVIDINSTREINYLNSILKLNYPSSFSKSHLDVIEKNQLNMLTYNF
jgi:hypothetical protein